MFRIVGFVALISVAACGGSSTTNQGSPDARPGADATAAADARLIDATAGGAADARAADARVADAPVPLPDAALPDASLPPDAAAPADAMPDAGNPVVDPTAYRFDFLALRDPHGFVFGCSDITDPPGLFGNSVNGIIDDYLNVDGDNDDILDLSIMMVFDPLDTGDTASTDVELVFGDCTAPASSATCSATSATTRFAAEVTNQPAGTCLDTLADTVSSGEEYIQDYPPIGVTTAGSEPCFRSDAQSLTIPIAGAEITLEDARVAARYTDGGLVVGLIRGFISEANAETTEVPLPLLGDTPIADLLWGGENNGCPVDNDDPTPGDMDIGPDGVTLGWYFYLNFTAEEVAFEER